MKPKRKQIKKEVGVLYIEPNKLDELLHPVFKFDSKNDAHLIAKGLAASPGATSGKISFFSEEFL